MANRTALVLGADGRPQQIQSADSLAASGFVGPLSGNATTATALATPRTINGTSFDGTANITVTAAAGTLTGATLAAGVTASSLLSAAGGTFGTAAFRSTGTSGATIPLLNGTNGWSGINTFLATTVISLNDAVTNAPVTALTLSHNTSGTPAAGLGTGIAFAGETSTTVDTPLGSVDMFWTDVTHASRTARGRLRSYYTNIATDSLYWGTNSSGSSAIGFLGAAPAVRQPGDVGTALVILGLMRGTPTFASANLTGRATNDYIMLRDEKSANTAGGTSTAGSWQTRTLNTEVSDTGNHCTLSGNQFTLLAGTYRIRASVPGYLINSHVARLQNITDGTTTIVGTAEQTNAATNNSTTRSFVEGRFTIGSTKTFEIQHRCGGTYATFGFGVPVNFSVTEVYTTVELEREAS